VGEDMTGGEAAFLFYDQVGLGVKECGDGFGT
jgi:hypothetical protein